MIPADPNRAAIRSFRDLIVWQKAVRLGVEIYAVTRLLPTEERFGLSQQLRRAGVSVASNIAEGHARQLRRDYVHFLSMARGSLAELDTQLEIARESQLLEARHTDTVEQLSEEVGRMLTSLIHKLARP
ncbi:MAG: four helix bundle protein [Gemmatimonadaceae bacterium]